MRAFLFGFIFGLTEIMTALSLVAVITAPTLVPGETDIIRGAAFALILFGAITFLLRYKIEDWCENISLFVRKKLGYKQT